MTQEMLPGFEEVTGKEVPAPAPTVTLTARDIHNAFEEKKRAIMARANAHIDRINADAAEQMEWRTAEDIQADRIRTMVEAQVEYASAEVDRVTTLMHWFEIESIFKAQQIVK